MNISKIQISLILLLFYKYRNTDFMEEIIFISQVERISLARKENLKKKKKNIENFDSQKKRI